MPIDGARRVGKSFIVEEFARKKYKSYILIDFNEAGKEITDLFDMNLRDLDSFFMYLSAAFNVKLYERESLLIFDQVQLYPRARAAIKFLVADGRFDYIETGSLMLIKKNVKDILIPSEERHMKMYPMDFEEFLWAKGEDMIIPVIRDCFEKKSRWARRCTVRSLRYSANTLSLEECLRLLKNTLKRKALKRRII